MGGTMGNRQSTEEGGGGGVSCNNITAPNRGIG